MMITRDRIAAALLLVCIVTTLVALPAAADAADAKPDIKEEASKKAHFDPVIKDIEGWTVHVDLKMLEGEHAEAGASALTMLANHLQRIVILHELVHAYHDQILGGYDEPRIKAAYEKAMKAGIYDKVLLYTGQKVRPYVTSLIRKEYVERTEAYFYRNDFYPFVRAELKEHDPVLHDLLEEIWGIK